MEQNEREDPRPSNDSRKRASVEAEKTETVETTTPSFRQRWRDAQPTKMMLVWACIAGIALTMLVGFNFGGWKTAGGAQKMADTTVKEAVIQRLAPMCVAQFNLDPDKDQKLAEMSESTTYQRTKYVREQGWATMSGESEPDRQVATECAKLLMELAE